MTVEWFVPLGQARPITMALHSLMADVRVAPGCLGCSVSADLTNQGKIRYVEEWGSEEDLRRRLQEGSFTTLAGLLEGATEPPHIEFMLPGGTRGLELVEEVRRTGLWRAPANDSQQRSP
jgi:quinol monooxygenase YgiN